MRATITDARTLSSLRPAEVATYLRSHGWKTIREIGDKGAIWNKANPNGSPELLLPLRRDLDDYAERMGDVLQALESYEERSQLDLLRDITEASSDVIGLRLQGDAYSDGSLSINDAAQVVDQAREMMLAAACSTVHPRQVFRTRRPAQAVDYMQKVRLGQTERGSYVLNIHSAVPPSFSERTDSAASFSLLDEPFERRVSLTLAHALIATRAALAHAAVTNDIMPFQEAVSEGVSANLCAALAGMNAGGNAQSVELGFRWSPMRRLPPGVQPPTRIQLSSDALATLAEVARELRGRADYEDFELSGFVTSLNREQDQGEGQVTITGLMDGGLKKVVVDLDRNSYLKALRAHAERLSVACVGDLVRDGRSFRLVNPRDFDVARDL